MQDAPNLVRQPENGCATVVATALPHLTKGEFFSGFASPGEGMGPNLMLLGRVIGNVVCTVKSDALEGKKLMLVQPLDKQLKDKGKTIVALDSVGAGTGELIYWCRGKEASFPWPEQEVPTEASIVGIVDELHLG
jgi:microcompartment protein CcmK/EutM